MRNRLSTVLCLAMLSGAAGTSSAQTTETDRRSPGPGPIEVTLDLRTGAIGSALPFDVPFILKVEDKTNQVAGVALSIFEAGEPFQVLPCGKDRTPKCGDSIDEGWKCVEPELQRIAGPVHPRSAGAARTYPPVQCTLDRNVDSSAPRLKRSGTNVSADFVLHVPALAANSYHQLLLLYRLDEATPQDEALLARFESRAAKIIADRYAAIDPLNAPYGSFPLFQQALLQELVALARDHGLEAIDDLDHPLVRLSVRALTPDGRSPQETLKESFDTVTRSGASSLVSSHVRLSAIVRPACRSELGDLQRARAWIEAVSAGNALTAELHKVLEAERVKSFLKDPLPNPCESGDPAQVEATSTALKELVAGLDAAEMRAGEIPGGEDLHDALKKAEVAASSLGATAARIARNLRMIEEGAKLLAKSFSAFVTESNLLARASTIGTFETRAKWQISGDFGVAWAPDVDEALPFLGTNFYLRPVNKQSPLPKKPWKHPLRRMSVTVGLVLTDVGDDRTREALFDTGDFSLLLGGGLRLTDSIRLGAGAVVFKELDPDPLVDDSSTTSSPYVSLAIDWDLRSLVQWMQRLWPNS